MTAASDRSPEILHPATVSDVVEAVRDCARLQVVGAATKSALAASRCDAVRCEMTHLSGVVDHQPSEFLLTALAGTRISELHETLERHGQYFPFDPPLVAAGATIGGTLAAGLSGPGRLRYGGIRDFVMGIRFVDGLGQVVTAGGRVVKNAAGYDIPKLMVGSCGYLGAIVEVTLKVFPRPASEATLSIKTADFAAAAELQSILARSPIELTAVDLIPERELLIRLSGNVEAVETLSRRVATIVEQHQPAAVVESCSDAAAAWGSLQSGTWAGPDEYWVRVALGPRQLAALEHDLAASLVPRRYSAAGNLAWLRWPASRPLEQLDDLLRHHRLGGSVLTGQTARYRLGTRGNAAIIRRIKRALDPAGKFVGFA